MPIIKKTTWIQITKKNTSGKGQNWYDKYIGNIFKSEAYCFKDKDFQFLWGWDVMKNTKPNLIRFGSALYVPFYNCKIVNSPIKKKKINKGRRIRCF